MDYFTLEALPALHGDSLLLHYGTDGSPGLIMIDGGPSKVWKKSLQPRLQSLAAKRPDGTLRIDLLMVSHIDDDHMQGVVDFTGAWRNADSDGLPWPFPVDELWHNSFERVSGADPTKVTASVLASTGAPALPDVELEAGEDEDEDEARDRIHSGQAALKVLASVAQGSQLRKDSDALGLPRNTGFDGLVRPGSGPQVPYELGPELKLHVTGPLPKQLDKLRKKFAEDLPPLEALAAYVDESVPNLSSIVVLASYKGKTMLLTGDARGDYVLEGLKQEGLLDGAGKLHVDLLKMPHHGSVRNLDVGFFRDITADHYVASADGDYGNPDRETMELVIASRAKADKYTIHLTYPVAAIDAARKAEWDKARASAIAKAKKKVPRAWNAATDELDALFKKKQGAGYAFTVSASPAAVPGAPVPTAKIELLDAIPF